MMGIDYANARAEEQRRMDEEVRRRRLDLHDMLIMEAGYQWLARLLKELGAGCCTASEEDQLRKNMAEGLLDEMAAAHPGRYLQFMAELRNVNVMENENVADD